MNDQVSDINEWKRANEDAEEGVLKEKEELIRDINEQIKVLKKAQIIIYAILGHNDKAVKIALGCGDVLLAKKYANRPDEQRLKRRLWMKIAKYLFNYQGKTRKVYQNRKEYTIQESLQILNPKESKLRIDDLLPIFPANEKVADLKEHLCDCLNDYNDKIQNLKKELEEYSNNSEILRKQQRKLKHDHISINPSQMCDLCYKPVFEREFLVFPCSHAFHRICIYTKLYAYQAKD